MAAYHSYTLLTAMHNSTLPSNGTPGDESDISHSRVIRYTGVACFLLFGIVGIIGNFISILALARCPRLRNATTAFVINLCFADLIFCSFSNPLQVVMHIKDGWPFGDGILCKLFPFVSYGNGLVSLFTVVAIAINRYIRVVHPLWYPTIYSRCKVAAMIATLWTSVAVLFFLPFFKVWGRLGYHEELRGCDLMLHNGKSPKRLMFFIALGLPTVVFIFCYTRIYCVVRRVSRKMCSVTHLWSENPNAVGSDLKDASQSSKTRKITVDKKELKVLKAALVIFCTYVICYFPVSLAKIIWKDGDLPTLTVVGFLLVYLANCINPFIYIATSDEYRKAYLDLFSCKRQNSSA